MAPSTPSQGGSVDASLVTFAERLADAAGEVIRRYWRLPIEVESKDEPGRPVAESPVTIADREAERAMRTLISASYPSHGIFGEELGQTGLDSEYVWVLDPIDGTKSFITGKPLFGTLIALLRHGRPVLGVVDQCILRERWVGANGKTLLNGKPVSCRGAPSLGDAMLYATTPHMFAPGVEETRFAQLRDQVKRPLYGCDCYAYALLASGFVDLVVEADLGVYDYCALVPVVIGAGGRISDWNGQALTLHSATKDANARVLAAATEKLWREALKVLSDESAGRSSTAAGADGSPGVLERQKTFMQGAACGALVVAAAAFVILSGSKGAARR